MIPFSEITDPKEIMERNKGELIISCVIEGNMSFVLNKDTPYETRKEYVKQRVFLFLLKNKETKMRYLPLSPALKPLLIEAYNNRAEGQEYLFSQKRENCTASSKDFSRYINTLRHRINSYYPELKHFTLYYLRKTVATNLEICEVGNPWAKQFFGHSPTDVKAKHYDKFDFEKHLRKKYQPYMEYADKSFARCLEKSEDIYEELVNANVFNSKNGRYIQPEKRHKSATKSKPKYTHFWKVPQ
ncbi:MAG: tyrosine-type recombinase/integrase [Eubacterium sp.]